MSFTCRGVLPGGTPCSHDALPGEPYCEKHLGPLRLNPPASPREFMKEWLQTAEGLFERRRRGEKPPPDTWDPELVRTLLPFALPFYYWYWRVEVDGIPNIPAEGPALLAANHSGAIPIDGMMLKVAVLKEHGRNPWLLAADLAFKTPGLKQILRVAGNARADRQETLELLNKGELVGVFPEGFKGIGKGWAKRYQLQRFGRGGFVEMALMTGAPIIPCAIIGAEEAYPMIADLKPLARRLGLPYIPVTPFFPLLGPLGALPLPSKWIIAFGEPIPVAQHGPEAADDTQLVLEISEDVRQTVQSLLKEHLAGRRHAFL
ncbi:MAG: lysophospholipid acyltransferase family protein [Actinomycetota bacterium]|nr:acyltransferase family protein [Actinomycetota bacterium]